MANEFQVSYRVRTTLQTVAAFHQDVRALKRLTPPPVFVKLHYCEPLAEGSLSRFTMWFGPLPVGWTAVHTNVELSAGFVDTQVKGPMKTWIHLHEYKEDGDSATILSDRIIYEHFQGLRGWLTRILFAPAPLRFMFIYRKWVIGRLRG